MDSNTTVYLFVAVFFLVGIALVYGGVTATLQGLSSGSWPAVNGTIIRTNVTVSHSYSSSSHTETTSYYPDVTYSYQVGGRNFSSGRITVVSTGGSYSYAYGFVTQHPVGSSVTVYYNPSDPSQALLEKGVDLGSVVLLVAGLAMMIVMGFMLYRRIKQPSSQDPSGPITPPTPPNTPGQPTS